MSDHTAAPPTDTGSPTPQSEADAAALLRDAMLRIGTNRQLESGDTLCVEGDESHEAYVVVDGCICARVAGHAGDMTLAEHRSGSIIGEVTTLIGGHRTATLQATMPTVVAVLDRSQLRAVFEDHPDEAMTVMAHARERTDRSRVAALLSEELQAPDGEVVAAIADHVTWTSLAAGDVLFRKGDAADAAYLVVSGRLGITDLGAARPRDVRAPGTRMIEIGRGGIVGEFGLLEDRERSATVVALRDTALARLSAEDFGRVAQDYSSLAMGLVRRVLDRSGNDSANITTKRSFALAITADVDGNTRQQLITTIVEALTSCGSTAHLTAPGIDETLRQPGISDTVAGGFGEIRLAELLHQAETDADHLVLDTGVGLVDSATPEWTRRALRHGDQLVIITSPEPGATEEAAIRALLDATPKQIPQWLALLHPDSCRQPSGTAAVRERFGVDEIHHLRGTSRTELARLARLAGGRGIGLVLSGGGARGHAHIGVYSVLHDLGVPVDRVTGASMGSIVAGGIGQQLSPDALLTDMQKGADNLLDYTIPFVSLIKGERIVSVLEQQFDGWEVEDMWVPFRCVSTDLTTAEVITHCDGPVATAIRTSVSIPGILPPVAYQGHLLADGGVLDNLPIGDFANDPSVGVIIASDVAPPLGPSAKGDFGLSVSGWKVARSRFVPRPLRNATSTVKRAVSRSSEPEPEKSASFPGVGTTLLRSLLIGSSRSRDEHLASGAIDLYLELDLREIPLLDFGQVANAADAGLVQSRGPITDWLDVRGGSPWGTPQPTAPEPTAEPEPESATKPPADDAEER